MLGGISVTGEVALGDLLVGIGTLALAATTWWLAQRSGKQVALAQEGLELTRDSIEALDRPFLVADPEHFDEIPIFSDDSDEEVGYEWGLFAELENLGSGPAVFHGAGLTRDGIELVDPSWSRELLLKTGETSGVGIGLEGRMPPEDGAKLILKLHYRSASGAGYCTTHGLEVLPRGRLARLDVHRSGPNNNAG